LEKPRGSGGKHSTIHTGVDDFNDDARRNDGKRESVTNHGASFLPSGYIVQFLLHVRSPSLIESYADVGEFAF
jgi:hypothetical protein